VTPDPTHDQGRPRAATLVRALIAGGWSCTQAGNLAAFLLGLRPAASGWSTREIDHLLFLRALVDAGRINP
jgi:hypothetical protein